MEYVGKNSRQIREWCFYSCDNGHTTRHVDHLCLQRDEPGLVESDGLHAACDWDKVATGLLVDCTLGSSW